MAFPAANVKMWEVWDFCPGVCTPFPEVGITGLFVGEKDVKAELTITSGSITHPTPSNKRAHQLLTVCKAWKFSITMVSSRW
jgi:hypothetical protein